jgi:glycosyltransferase involved in cell wall biosynthesis
VLPIWKRRGVLFIGYAEGDLGLGQSFRCNVEAAYRAGVRGAIYPFRVGVETRLIEPFMPERYDTHRAYRINLIEVAPDQTPVVFRNVDRRLTDKSYNILRTFWELPQAPLAWRDMLHGVDEIWAPNDFVAKALAGVFSGKITIIPPAVEVGEGPFEPRESFGFESDRFYFLFSFDYFSSPDRKNPFAVVRAFQQAFAENDQRVGLVVKSIGAEEQFPEIKSFFRETARKDPRIIVIDHSLKRREMLSLIRSCDAYISLHRSEGFGFGMAEAMNFGRIVIGTDFSGNRDFLTPETGFPVSYTLRAVESHEYSWSDGQVWAEPNEEEAAVIMRQVVDQSDLAAERARTGQRFIRENFGAKPIGETIRRRVEEIERFLTY